MHSKPKTKKFPTPNTQIINIKFIDILYLVILLFLNYVNEIINLKQHKIIKKN